MASSPTLPLTAAPPVLPEGFTLFAGFAAPEVQHMLAAALARVLAVAPVALHRTKGGGTFSAAFTNCGKAGWWSDEKGYRYTAENPDTGTPWPPIPA